MSTVIDAEPKPAPTFTDRATALERALADAIKAAIDTFFYVDGIFQSARMSHIVDGRNFDRLNNLLQDAVARGARVETEGGRDKAVLRIEPTLLSAVPHDALILRDEIFGPILPIVAYDHPDQVEALVDATGKPLAVYILSVDDEFVDDMLIRTSSGGVTVNGVMTHFSETRLPFGGVNTSGMGRYRGHAGFLELSNARSIFQHRVQATAALQERLVL